MSSWIKKNQLKNVTQNYQRPTYVYKLSVIKAQLDKIRSAFGTNVRIHYAMKANSNLKILQFLASHGVHADTVSFGEIQRALQAGFKPSDILFAGVGKSREEIRGALKKNIFMFNVESQAELERIAKEAQVLKKQAQISLRLNPDVSAKTHPYIATGFRENKFGIDPASLKEIVKTLKKYPKHLSLRGIGFHIGSQIMSPSTYLDAIRKTVPVFEELRASGFELKYFDLGGGFGVDYKNKTRFDLPKFANAAKKLLKPLGVTIITEPGRFLTAEAGCLLTRVEYVKKTRFKTFVIVDTGMHHLLRPSLYSAFHAVTPVAKRPGKEEKVDVVGPICESSDFIAKGRKLAPVKEGDFLIISHAGAYGFVMASLYNLKGLPKEVIIP